MPSQVYCVPLNNAAYAFYSSSSDGHTHQVTTTVNLRAAAIHRVPAVPSTVRASSPPMTAPKRRHSGAPTRWLRSTLWKASRFASENKSQ